MKIINLKTNPEYLEQAVHYYQTIWGNESNRALYDNSIRHAVLSRALLPQWYLLIADEKLIGTVGLVTNGFISRMDLIPWIAALYIDPDYRNQGLGGKLLKYVREEAARLGFSDVYLATDHVGYYERYQFKYIADGYHPWGEKSRIYHASSLEK